MAVSKSIRSAQSSSAAKRATVRSVIDIGGHGSYVLLPNMFGRLRTAPPKYLLGFERDIAWFEFSVFGRVPKLCELGKVNSQTIQFRNGSAGTIRAACTVVSSVRYTSKPNMIRIRLALPPDLFTRK